MAVHGYRQTVRPRRWIRQLLMLVTLMAGLPSLFAGFELVADAFAESGSGSGGDGGGSGSGGDGGGSGSGGDGGGSGSGGDGGGSGSGGDGGGSGSGGDGGGSGSGGDGGGSGSGGGGGSGSGGDGGGSGSGGDSSGSGGSSGSGSSGSGSGGSGSSGSGSGGSGSSGIGSSGSGSSGSGSSGSGSSGSGSSGSGSSGSSGSGNSGRGSANSGRGRGRGDTANAASASRSAQNQSSRANVSVSGARRDDDGGGFEDNEIVVLGLGDQALADLRSRGYGVLREVQMSSVGGALTRIALPPGVAIDAALAETATLAPLATATRNHRYRPQNKDCDGPCAALKRVAWPTIASRCTQSMSLGVIDTNADLNHPSLRGAEVVVRRIGDTERPRSGLTHGTAVVSLLLGNGNSGIQGLIPGARILLADAFHSGPDGDVADTVDIAAAIDWLVDSRVPVIQMSLAGPDNPILQRLVAAARLRGHLLIAAAGNQPGGAASAYPAAYPGVVGVAAATVDLRPYRQGTRGAHVDLSAPGVDLQAAVPGGTYSSVSGTSFATAFVAAAHALALTKGLRGDQIFDLLASSATDLGPPGRDSVFGFGLLQIPESLSCR